MANNGEQNPSFDFDKWIIKHNLQHIKYIFIENNMCTFDSLSVNNCKFNKFITDSRIISIKENILNAIQYLDEIREQSNKKQSLFVPINEDEILNKIIDYSDETKKLSKYFEQIPNKYNPQQLDNTNELSYYYENTKKQLNKINTKIKESFAELHELLNQQETILKEEINEFNKELKRYELFHNLNGSNSSKLNDTLSALIKRLDNDEKYFNKYTKVVKV